MQMLNQLASGPAVIAQQIIAVGIHRGGNGPGDPAETRGDLAQKLSRTIMQLFKVLLWNNQSMAVAYGADIEKREHNFIFVNPRNRDLSGHHFAKDAIILAHSDVIP
jgi:hypothetical protein